MKVLVTGAGGAIFGYMVGSLLEQGHEVRAVDIKDKSDWWQVHDDAENYYLADLQLKDVAQHMVDSMQWIYHGACNMGGINFIENNKVACDLSSLIDLHLMQAVLDSDVERIFYSSSACIYNTTKQKRASVKPLKETDAYPAQCEDGYGWQKLSTERLLQNIEEEYYKDTRVARFHNIYMPKGAYDNAKGKAPASISRKIAEAKLSGNFEIEIWGDGNQTRTFCWIDDCINGIHSVMDGPYPEPVNVGSSELVTINQLVDIVEEIAGIKVKRTYNLSAPQGVRGRSSDNTMFRERYGWEPSTPLKEGMEEVYKWVYQELSK